ncbi:hypothetical protein BH11PLA2_BH11PLA2_28390 [soil metagenome]
MSAMLTPPGMPSLPRGSYHRLSVADYHEMIERRILTENDKVELIEGILVDKMSRDPKHDFVIQSFQDIVAALPPIYSPRVQCAVTLADSELEPDFAIVRGSRRNYLERHPGPNDILILM